MKRKVLITLAVILLLAGGALMIFLNSNYYYSKKLVSAIYDENIIAVQQIIEKKPTCVNTYPSIMSTWWRSAIGLNLCYYPLNVACATDNIDLIKLLIDNGADINCNDGLTPLSITYTEKLDNWYVISQFLIENGASLNYITDYSGGKSSILQDIVQCRPGAALPGYEPDNPAEVIKAFNYALKNLNYDNVDWTWVLKESVCNDRTEIVKLLLDQKYCTINEIAMKKTALIFAAMSSTPEMVQLLLDYGADKNIKCSDGKTAYDYAVEYDNKDVIPLLKD